MKPNSFPLSVPLIVLTVATVAIAGLSVFPDAARAQPPRGPAGPAGAGAGQGAAPRGPGGDERMRSEVMERMRTMRMWKLTEELRLDEKQAAQVFPMLARFDERERDLAKQQGELVRSLRAELDAPGGNPNKANLNKLIDGLLSNRAKKFAFDEERTKGLRKVLEPVQQARLVLLLPRLDEAFRRHIHHAIGRDRDGGRGDRDGGGDRGDRDGRGNRDHRRGF